MNVFRSLLETEHGLEVYNIGTRSSTKASGEIQPEVHGPDKPLDPNLKPEHCKGLKTGFLLFVQDAPCLVCWFSCSFVSEACACFGECL